jgi:hypothetical protein
MTHAVTADELLALGSDPVVRSRFFSMVDRSRDCWFWTGSKSSGGYGRMTISKRTLVAHRISLAVAGVRIPPGLVVDHKCRNRACVNPGHLRLVTPLENTLENSVALTAMNRQKTHCSNGHEFTPENTKWRKKGGGMGRNCRACEKMHKRKLYLRKKAALQGRGE